MPSDLVVPLSFRVDGLQYLQCQAVHMEFGDVEAWDVYLTSTTEKVRKTPKNVGDAGVMRHATWFTFRRALKILTIYVYTYIYIHVIPQKNLYQNQDPWGSVKTFFLDSLSAYKDVQCQIPDFVAGAF